MNFIFDKMKTNNLNNYEFKKIFSIFIVINFIEQISEDRVINWSTIKNKICDVIDFEVEDEIINKFIENNPDKNINDFKKTILEKLNYEERLKMLNALFSVKKFIHMKNTEDCLIEFANLINCRKSDYMYLHNKYKKGE
jgi:hypothetical protein